MVSLPAGFASSLGDKVCEHLGGSQLGAFRRQCLGVADAPNGAAGAEESFQSMINDLQTAICTRLDRIESSLHRLHTQRTLPERQQRSFGHKSTSKGIIEIDTDCSPLPSPSNGVGQVEVLTPQAEVQTFDSQDASNDVDADDAVQGCGAQQLALRPQWLEHKPMEAVAVLAQARHTALRTTTTLDLIQDEVETPKAWYIILPVSRFRLCWDVTMMFLIAHDMAVVPITLAFDTGNNVVTDFFFWPFLLYWTLDIPLSFVTAFHNKNGEKETRIARIALRYLMTWFTLDIFVVGSAWFELWMSTDSTGVSLGRVGKSLRIMRIIHAMRVLRFAKMRKLIEDFQDRIASTDYRILAGIAKIMLTIVWVNHFIACGWWALGEGTSDGGRNDSWTSYGRFEEADLAFKYFSSLHWSLTQFTPAGMEVTARNLPERIYSVVVLLFAMVAFSSFVSSITSAMTQLRQLHTTHEAGSSLLRRFLRFHQVPIDLTMRILNCVEYQVKKQQTEIQEGQVDFLKFLSRPLRLELSKHIFAPVLMRHPFFIRYSEIDLGAMRNICLQAVVQVSLAKEDILFTEGCRCEQMFFLTSGQLRYKLRKGRSSTFSTNSVTGMSTADAIAEDFPQAGSYSSSLTTSPRRKTLEEGQWCCEVSIWCPWLHVGTMSAHWNSEVLAMSMSTFMRVTSEFHLADRFSARYAALFLEYMQEYVNDGEQVSDMPIVSLETLEQIVHRAYMMRTPTPSVGLPLGSTPSTASIGCSTPARASTMTASEMQAAPEQQADREAEPGPKRTSI